MISLDFPESKRAGVAPREIAALSLQLTEHIREVFWLTTPDWQEMLYVSSAYEEIWGRSCESLYARPLDWLNSVVDADREQVIAAISRKSAGDLADVAFPEYRIRRPDGSERWIYARAFPVCDAEGKVLRIAGIAEDITERKLARIALKESEHNYKEAQAIAHIGSWHYVLAGQLTWSDELYRIYGVSPETFTPSVETLIKLIHPDDRPAMQAWINTCASGQQVGTLEFRCVWPDGTIRYISGQGKLTLDADGKPIHMAGTAQDITERKLVELALLEAEQRKDEFLAMLAHELRNPLAPIRNAAYVLTQPGLDESRVKWAGETIEAQVTHLTRLVDDLLDISRIAHGKITLKAEEIELDALVEPLMQSIRPSVEKKGQRLAVRMPEHPVQLRGDPVRLNQILFNLLDNAIKFTPDGGQIEFAARITGQEIEISVRDNGMGIRVELLPRVFDLFQQDERTLDRPLGGLGVGLTLAQRLVGIHGGQITAHSGGPGMGTTFTVWLPAMAMPARPAAPESEDNVSVASGMRVLVVDDDVAVACSTVTLLEVKGYTVRSVDTGGAALEQIPVFQPQVVLLDIGLKGMDGFETARRLRKLPEGRDLCLVALTGYADERYRAQALASGCDHFLVKPVKVAVLSDLLAKVARTGA